MTDAPSNAVGDDIQALKVLSEQSGVPGIDLNQVCIRLTDLRFVPRELAEQREMVPVLVKGERLFLAMAEPADKRGVNELEFSTGKKVFSYIALRSTLRRVIKQAYDLADQGYRHYVGPACPPETLAKAGVQLSQPAQPLALGPQAFPPPQGQAAIGGDHAGGGDQSGDRISLPHIPEESLLPHNSTGQGAGVPSAVVVSEAMREAAPNTDMDSEIEFAQPMFETEQPPAPHTEQPPTEPFDPNRQTVLVVDDEPDVRGLLVRVFSGRGYRVLEAENGERALQIVNDNMPDLVILDAMLPQMHGFEIARRLKGSERHGHIPIVMVSAVYRGWRFAEDVKENYGVEAYLEKPFKVTEVVAAVEQALAAPTERQAAERGSGEAQQYLAASMQAYRAGDMENAVAQLQQGIQRDALAYKLRFHLGLLYAKMGKLYDAIQELEMALSVRSSFYPALKNLAVLYQNVGFRNKAVEMWERSLAAAPDDETRENIKQHLVAALG